MVLTTYKNNNDKKEIKIMFWNMRSFCCRKEEIEDLLKKLDILIDVETWLKSDKNINYTGFNILRADRLTSKYNS